MRFQTCILTFAVVVSSIAAAQNQPPAAVPSAKAIHQKLGAFVYPAKNQTAAQQQKDESECYAWAKSQTGIDPMAPAAPAQPASTQDASSAGKGSRAKGAARGAAAGAAIGAISGDAGAGAATGAAVGTVAGGARKRRAQREAESQQKQTEAAAKQQAAGAEAQRMATFKKAYAACVSGRGYTVQ